MVCGSLDPKSSAVKSEKNISHRQETVILSYLCTKLAKKLFLVNYFLPCKEIMNIWGLLLSFTIETEA